MKIKSYKLEATIPTTEFGNLRPTFEMEGTDIKKMSEVGLEHIMDLHKRFSKDKLGEYKGKKVNIIESSLVQFASFNERGVVVEFDNLAHAYTYKGEKLESASGFTKKYCKPFNAELIAKNCEKSWGVPAKDIVNMWKSNGSLASEFGTSIHNALEHWIKFGEIGNTIMLTTGKDVNPALPKHPVLNKVIVDFINIAGQGEFIPEVFVTDVKNKRCGRIDRLKIIDKAKKICRVQDYKVNVNSEEISTSNKLLKPFNELPANKLSKYQVQLSFYAEVLRNTGWTVDGLDIFVYENSWKKFEMPVIGI